MFAALLTYVTGPFRTIAIWIAVATIVIGIGFTYLKVAEHNAAAQATLEYNNEQLRMTMHQNQEFYKKNNDLAKQVEDLSKEVTDLNQTVQNVNDATAAWIASQKEQGKVDPFFNELLNQMKGKSK